jgi:hypothetical protein
MDLCVRGRRMRCTSVFADDARFTFRQFITGREFDTFDRFEQISGGSFANVTHAMMPEIHGFNNLGEENCLSRTGRKNEFKIDKI